MLAMCSRHVSRHVNELINERTNEPTNQQIRPPKIPNELNGLRQLVIKQFTVARMMYMTVCCGSPPVYRVTIIAQQLLPMTINCDCCTRLMIMVLHGDLCSEHIAVNLRQTKIIMPTLRFRQAAWISKSLLAKYSMP